MTKEEFVAGILAKKAEKKLKKTEKKLKKYVEGVLGGVSDKDLDCSKIEEVDATYGAEFDFSYLSLK